MLVLRPTDKNYARRLRQLDRCASPDRKVEKTVREILEAVEKSGDKALLDYHEKFGGGKLRPRDLPVPPSEVAAALAGLPASAQKALIASRNNVAAFARRSLRKSWFMRNRQGAIVGERFDPFPSVGLYIPGGSAPLISTAIMTATLAREAGVPRIAAVTPADSEGRIHPALLAALAHCGVHEIYRVGGAQAVAALAFGTRTIRPVRKIFGPGSPWVVEAKRQLFGRIAVDLLPGPSEILVLADDSANPDWIAADLLAQAEHGLGSLAALFTPSAKLLRAVQKSIAARLPSLPRAELLALALENSLLVQVPSMEHAVDLANRFACEHVSIACREPGQIAAALNSSGAIFLGGLSPVAAGDFLAGPSHTLPTGGAGKSFAGLTVDQFQRRTSILRFDEASLRASDPIIQEFSRLEGLAAHGQSVSVRLESPSSGKPKAAPKAKAKAKVKTKAKAKPVETGSKAKR